MGWSGASDMVGKIIHNINKIKPKFTHEQKVAIYLAMIDPIEDQDGELYDLMYDSDPAFIEAFKKDHSWDEDE